MAVFITERSIQNVEAAAVLADEYVLTHRDVKNYWRRLNGSVESAPMETRSFLPVNAKLEKKQRSLIDKGDQCAYCLNKGHWKKDCPALKAKMNHSKSEPKSALAVSSVIELVVPDVDVAGIRESLVAGNEEKLRSSRKAA